MGSELLYGVAVWWTIEFIGPKQLALPPIYPSIVMVLSGILPTHRRGHFLYHFSAAKPLPSFNNVSTCAGMLYTQLWQSVTHMKCRIAIGLRFFFFLKTHPFFRVPFFRKFGIRTHFFEKWWALPWLGFCER